MIINYTLTGSIEVPEGSKLSETETAIILPNGDWIKPWDIWELNDVQDLTYDQLAERDCYWELADRELEHD